MSDKEGEKREIKPVANGSVTRGRRSALRVIYDEVIVKNFQDIKNNFIQDVIIPSTFDWLYDVGTSFISDMFKSSRGSTLPKQYGKTSYSSYFKGSGSKERRYEPEDDVLTYKDISFGTRKEAEIVIANLRGALIEYDVVTISDLCYFSHVSETWADRKYGWTNLDRASSFRGKNGRYYLNLPEPVAIEND